MVRAYQVGEANGVHFICMEFLEGETLDDVITRRKRLPWAEAVRLVDQALGGLQHLHEKRMVHRDVKPANMMLTPAATKPDTTWDATIKILDIGLGRELFSEDTPEAQIETQLTVEGAVLGTPDYLAPEQAKDARSADIRADIYSIGCVLYHCLAGTPPFPSTNIMSQMVMHATEQPPPLASVAPDAPPGLQGVFDRLMAKSPDDRYQTPAAAAAAIAPLLRPGGSAPAAAAMVPAFKDWLETESHLEMPANLPAAPAVPAKPVPAKPVAPGTAPQPAVKPGTAPVSAMKGELPLRGGSRAAREAAGPRECHSKPGCTARAAIGSGAVSPVPVDEVDVELVLEPGLVLAPPAAQPEQPKEERSLLEPDRRDWIMLAAGASGVLLAVGLGYGLARLLRKKPEEPPAEE